MGANPDAIEMQEKRGQSDLVNSDSLPTEIYGKEKLETLGIKFGEPYLDDPLFCDAVLPKGFKKVPHNHNMWSDLVDANGKVVAIIFYKAAFYDRKASIAAT